MPNVLIRDVPADVHARLLQRAERAGQSLQQYLSGELARIVGEPTVDEVLDRVARRRGGRIGLATAVDDLREARGRQ